MHFMNDDLICVWVYSIGATLLISAVPCFILLFIPIRDSSAENSTFLKVLLAFGAGGLLGDAFLHLIPHATPASSSHGHSHAHTHSHTSGAVHEPHDTHVGIWVLVGFMTFFIVEKFVRILRGDDAAHGHSHGAPLLKKPDISSKTSSDSSLNTSTGSINSSSNFTEPKRIRVAAILNLVADFMHNTTDGMSIGASFIAGPIVGVGTMVAVLIHEIPHEIGDFAILIQSGYTKYQAAGIQLLTAIGALGGCILSLLSVSAYESVEAATQSWILPFTAGGFIYIASVSILPELLQKSSFLQSLFEVAAILMGLFMMYLIALYE